MEKKNLQNIIRTFLKWSGIILAMILFAFFAAIMSNLLQDKIWVVLVLNLGFWILFWILLKQSKYFTFNIVRIRKHVVIVIISVFFMALILFVLATATLGLFDILLVRLNIILFIIMPFVISYIEYLIKKQKK